MYRNLMKSVQIHDKFVKQFKVFTCAAYHNESSYYGYRPKVKREWKSMHISCSSC
jgi:hypothetical protein